MQRFVDDDRGYLDWLDHYPDGFVINTGRTLSAAYLMLHRSSIEEIEGWWKRKLMTRKHGLNRN